jgi:hypothetical protein
VGYVLLADKLYREASNLSASSPTATLRLGFTPGYGSYVSLLLPRLSRFKLDGEYGLRLRCYGCERRFLCPSKDEMKRWYNSLKRLAVLRNIADKYAMGKAIGKGSYAMVHLGTRLKDGEEFAIKVIHKVKLTRNKVALVSCL